MKQRDRAYEAHKRRCRTVAPMDQRKQARLYAEWCAEHGRPAYVYERTGREGLDTLRAVARRTVRTFAVEVVELSLDY